MSEEAPYEVLYDSVMSILKTVRGRARVSGKAGELLAALEFLDEGLRKGPLQFGDPLHVQGNVHTMHRLQRPLNVTYAVHVVLKFVYVQKLSVSPKTPSNGPAGGPFRNHRNWRDVVTVTVDSAGRALLPISLLGTGLLLIVDYPSKTVDLK